MKQSVLLCFKSFAIVFNLFPPVRQSNFITVASFYSPNNYHYYHDLTVITLSGLFHTCHGLREPVRKSLFLLHQSSAVAGS